MSFIITLCLLAAPMTFSVRGGGARIGGERDRDATAPMFGVSASWRTGSLLLGASFDGSSRVGSLFIGDVRHLFFAVTGGFSLPLTDRTELQLVGEAGAHRVSGTRFGPHLIADSRDPSSAVVSVYNGTEPAWGPFAGLRPSLELSIAPLAIGVGIWARVDLLQLAPEVYVDPPLVPNSPGSPLNRVSFGTDVHLAFRFE